MAGICCAHSLHTACRDDRAQILAWRESGGAAAHAVWTALCECNVDIADKIGRLVHLAASTVPSDYNAGVALCAGLPSTEVRHVFGSEVNPMRLSSSSLKAVCGLCVL